MVDVPVIYPNPSSGEVNIIIDNQKQIEITISIINTTRGSVFKRSYSKSKDENILIDRSESKLSPGIYILNVSGESINTSNKLVVY